jgi:glycosyltransferase involved in cell wall biosynthesis
MYGGVLEDEVRFLPSVYYINLGKKGRYDISFFRTYRTYLTTIQPNIIYSFLPEMNLFSLWCKAAKTKLVWGFRACDMPLKRYDKMAQLLFFLQNAFSKRVDGIITNSKASIAFHQIQGFQMHNAHVVYNGIDTDRFYPSAEKRERFRCQYGISSDQIVVGLVGRIDVLKGHITFARVAKKILDEEKRFCFIVIGSGNEKIKQACQTLLGEYNQTRFIWLDEMQRIEDGYVGLDILCSTSLSESFSNVIAEAMSSEVPCVVTDVGDSQEIVGEWGVVIPPEDENALHDAIIRLSKADRAFLGQKSRQKIENVFSISRMVSQTEMLLTKIVSHEAR